MLSLQSSEKSMCINGCRKSYVDCALNIVWMMMMMMMMEGRQWKKKKQETNLLPK